MHGTSLMAALIYMIETLLSLCLLAVLLRLLLQWSRADFRNPLARSIVHLTNPVIVPLRRLLPADRPHSTRPPAWR